MSLADELLADLDEIGDEADEENEAQNENEIMEAMEGLDSLAEEPNLSIRAVAKLADSEEVRKVPVTVVYTVALMVSSTIHKW